MNTNAINWFAIPVTDLERARSFYTTIFGFDNMPDLVTPMGTCAVFPQFETGIGGSLNPFMEVKPSQDSGVTIWLNANPDLQSVLDKVVDTGGQILQEKVEIGDDYGFMAMMIDSEGNRIGLHSTS